MLSNTTEKSVVVSGAGGFIGYHLVRRLLRDNVRVLAIGRSSGRLGHLLDEELLTFMPCNLKDFDKLVRIVADFSPAFCYHFACQPDAAENFQHIRDSVTGNLELTINMLEAFTRSPNRELFIYGDSVKVYGSHDVPYEESLPPRPLASYAIAKMAAWEYCKLYHRMFSTRTVSIKPTLTYGPYQAFNVITYVVQSIIENRTVIELDGGNQTRALLYIDDCIEAYVRAMENKEVCAGHTIPIGGQEEISILGLARLIAEIMKSNISIIANQSRRRPTDINRCVSDNRAAREILGWSPSVTLREGLKATVDFLLASQNLGIRPS